MANYQTLKAAIQDVVKTNGENEITGALLQQTLLAIVNSLGSGYQFMGIATPTTNPGTPDAKVFYIATQPGVYTSFNSTTVQEYGILYYDSAWHFSPVGIKFDEYNGDYSVPIYVINNSVLSSYHNSLIAEDGVKTNIFNVVKYAGQTIKITASGLPTPNGVVALLACQKTDGTVVFVENTIASNIIDYEYVLPNDAYKLAITQHAGSNQFIRMTINGRVIESAYQQNMFSFVAPKPTIENDFWERTQAQVGLYTANGVLNAVSGFRTIKYDISQYVGKQIVFLFTGLADFYDNTWAAFVTENSSGQKTVHKDRFIGNIKIYSSTRLHNPFAICGYKVKENDKYLYISSAFGCVSVVADIDTIDTTLSPILYPVGYKAYQLAESTGTSNLVGMSQKAVTENIHSVNLFDPDSPDTLINKYIRANNGVIESFNGINESGFIPLVAGQVLKYTCGDETTWPYLAVAFYDSAKNFIGGIANPSTAGYIQTNLPNCAFMRMSYGAADRYKLVVSYDENVTEYIPYYDVHSLNRKQESANAKIADLYERIGDISGDGSQWNGKKWYAYGTSITSIAQGKYANYLASFGQMILTNKGIPGGGIGDLGGYSRGQVRTAIMNTTDGKLEADLITLEVGANDVDAGVPLGTIYDTDETTLCGCLNMCIRYLQANTNAQIVVMPSPAVKTEPNEADQYYKAQLLFKQVCFINKCHWIDGLTGMGYARINGNTLYVQDNIHQTNLGGYIFAKAIWSVLKSIPIWYTAIPTE